MDNKTFDTSLDGAHALIDSVLRSKGDEYTSGGDRLSQFKTAAKLQNITVKEALAGMMVKHTTSIYDMIGDGREHSKEKWDEKIIDHINYLILLRAIVEEEKDRELSSGVNTRLPDNPEQGAIDEARERVHALLKGE